MGGLGYEIYLYNRNNRLMEALRRRNAFSCCNNTFILHELWNFRRQGIVLKKACCGKIVLILST